MGDETGRPGGSGDEQHDPWAPPRDGAQPGRGSMNEEEARKRRAVADQPTVTSEKGAPPPVPPAPGGPAAPGSPAPGHGASPYAPPQQPSPYAQPQQPSPYGQPQPQQPYGGGAYGYPSPPPQPFGYAGAPVGYGWHGPPQQASGKAVASMVFGILGLFAVSTCWGSFVAIFLSPVALGLGLSGRRAADRGEAGGRSQAVAGYVMGIIGTVLSVLLVAFLLVMLIGYGEEFGRYDSDPPGGGPGLDARERASVLVLDEAR